MWGERENKLVTGGIVAGAELRRIAALPRRPVGECPDDAVELMTEWLRSPGGSMRLRPIQAQALVELHDRGGLFAPIPVGGGKTAISLLAPTVLSARRPLLLIPAALREKTWREMSAYARHWRIHPGIEVQSYETLSRKDAAQFLDAYRPDLIVADECHRLRNKSAAVTKRVGRYVKAARPALALMSGTIMKRSLADFAHLLDWCFAYASPLPRDYNTLMEWCSTLDVKKGYAPRVSPGEIWQIAAPGTQREQYFQTFGDQDKIQVAREIVRDRVLETPGVISTRESGVEASLEIFTHLTPKSDRIDAAFEKLRNAWERPDGVELMDAVEAWRLARELACGFYYRWEPEGPVEWRSARSTWAKAVREVLKYNRRGLDTELQVREAVAEGQYKEHNDALHEWLDVQPTFTPNSVPVWICDSVIDHAAAWAKKHRGIVWTDHAAFGRRIEEKHGIPYFGQQGEDSTGRVIEKASGAICASVAANATGRNLQAWHANLIVSMPPTGATAEQLIGRNHRQGQEADTVTVDYLIGCVEQAEGLERATEDARFLASTTGMPQKLLYADRVEVAVPSVGARWSK